jgi:integrase
MFGGLRTGDLHALRWESLDAVGGFMFGWAPRKKTARPQKLEIPAMLRPILNDWWTRQGQPLTGLVFPTLRGDLAGTGSKTGVSHSLAFRRDLRRAFGIEQLEEVTSKRQRPGRAPENVTRQEWRESRQMTDRERELFEDTEHTRPVDFHSWRRAYVQALAEAEVNAQQAAALAGHASLAAHGRYLANTAKARELPAAALPKLGVSVLTGANDSTSAPTSTESPKLAAGAEAFSSRAHVDSNHRPSAPEADALSS